MKQKTPHIDPHATYTLWWGSSNYTASGEMRESLMRILDAAGIKYVCVEECDCAEELRGRGDEYTFEMCARRNISMLKENNVTHIITPCPHAYNVMTRYYPVYGYSAQVWHHTDFIAALINEELLHIDHTSLSSSLITYHDPCRLSRMGHTESVREIIELLGGKLHEAPHHGRTSMCCGGGSYLDTSSIPVRVSIMRYEELLSTGADTMVTSCPICREMLLSARTGDGTAICDIATLVVKSILHS